MRIFTEAGECVHHKLRWCGSRMSGAHRESKALRPTSPPPRGGQRLCRLEKGLLSMVMARESY